jgi:hypothetical protein
VDGGVAGSSTSKFQLARLTFLVSRFSSYYIYRCREPKEEAEAEMEAEIHVPNAPVVQGIEIEEGKVIDARDGRLQRCKEVAQGGGWMMTVSS